MVKGQGDGNAGLESGGPNSAAGKNTGLGDRLPGARDDFSPPGPVALIVLHFQRRNDLTICPEIGQKVTLRCIGTMSLAISAKSKEVGRRRGKVGNSFILFYFIYYATCAAQCYKNTVRIKTNTV